MEGINKICSLIIFLYLIFIFLLNYHRNRKSKKNDKYLVKLEDLSPTMSFYSCNLFKSRKLFWMGLLELVNKKYYSLTKDKNILSLILVLSSAIFLIIGLSELLIFIKEKCHIASLIKKGILINVDIEGFYINTNAKMINGRHPYKLRASCINANNGIKYVFESENIYDDINRSLAFYKEKTIPVYLNKKNTYDYYLDTNVIFNIQK